MKTLTALIFPFLLVSFNMTAQDVTFNFENGDQNTYALMDVYQITFTGDVLNLELRDETMYSWNVNTITNFSHGGQVGVTEALSTLNGMELKLHPNPSSDKLQLTYTLNKESLVNVSIHTLEGKLAKRVFEGTQGEGQQSIEVYLEDLLSGTYLCRLSGDGFSIGKPIIVTK